MRTEAFDTISPFRSQPPAKGASEAKRPADRGQAQPSGAGASGASAASETRERFELPEHASRPERDTAKANAAKPTDAEAKAAPAAQAGARARDGAPGLLVMREVLAALAEQGRGPGKGITGEAAAIEAGDAAAGPDAALDLAVEGIAQEVPAQDVIAEGVAEAPFDVDGASVEESDATQPDGSDDQASGQDASGEEASDSDTSDEASCTPVPADAAPADLDDGEASVPVVATDDTEQASDDVADEVSTPPQLAQPDAPDVADADAAPPVLAGPFGGPMAGGRRGEGPPAHSNFSRSGRDWSPPGLNKGEVRGAAGQAQAQAAELANAFRQGGAEAAPAENAVGENAVGEGAVGEGAANLLADVASKEDAVILSNDPRGAKPSQGIERALERLRDAGPAKPAEGEGTQAAGKPVDKPVADAAAKSAAASPPPNPSAAMQALAGLAEAGIGKGQAAPATPTLPPPLVVPNAPLGSVPIEIGLKALAGINHFQIRLDPAELGRIDVTLEIDSEGGVKARLVVDRVETLTLLQREGRTLDRALEQAGLKPSDAGVDLSLRDQGRDERRGTREDAGSGDGSGERAGRGGDNEGRRIEPAVAQRTIWRGSAGIDVRI
jgi:flagellar hook-length control protein FliK